MRGIMPTLTKGKKVAFIICPQSVEPLGIGYLSSMLKLHGHSTDLIKYTKSELLYEDLVASKPDYIALSMTTGQHVKLLEAARKIKEWDSKKYLKIIAGGAHVTYFPGIAKDNAIDYIVRGESEYSFVKLINELANGVVITKKDCSLLTLPTRLDEIPFPDRGLIYKFSDFRDNYVRNVMTSRGCPFNCLYCYNSVYRELYKGQQIVRYRSAQNVIDECVDLISRYPTKMIFFADDEFSMNIERLQEMKKLYVEQVKLPFHCQIRIDMLNEKRIKLLKEMGCYSLTFAIESGDEFVRKNVLGRNISNQQILDGVKLLKKYRIKFRAENMIGLPNEQYYQVMRTLKLNIKVRPNYAWVSLFQPYPNTQLGDYCLRQGLFDGNADLIQSNFTDDTVIKMSEEKKNRLVNLQRLFGVIVAFPILYHILPWLLKLNLLKFYTKLRDNWKKTCYRKILIGIK